MADKHPTKEIPGLEGTLQTLDDLIEKVHALTEKVRTPDPLPKPERNPE